MGIMKKKRRVIKKKVANFITFILLCSIAFSSYKIYSIVKDEYSTKVLQNEFNSEGILNEKPAEADKKTENYGERFRRVKEINSDFKGWVVFESGLIDLPFVQSTDNDFYLTKNFKKEYSSHGTVFLDQYQTTDSKNLTLYGHYVYNNTSLMFSPLVKLAEQKNYEENQFLYVMTEDKIRKYQVFAIFKYSEADEPLYQNSDFTVESFEIYKEYVQNHRLYDTGVDISIDDKLINLQTCVRNEDTARWVVVGKMIEEKNS